MSNKPFKVPGDGVTNVATPSDWTFIQLMGSGNSYQGVHFTKQQEKDLKAFYLVSDEVDRQMVRETREAAQKSYEEALVLWEECKTKAEGKRSYQELSEIWKPYNDKYSRSSYGEPEKPAPPLSNEDALTLMSAGSLLNTHRHADRDGLRIMAFLSRYLEPGQDPVKLVVQLCIEAGYDVPNDYEWIYDEGEDDGDL